jgi:uncharacterized damage-inducible protein DinB
MKRLTLTLFALTALAVPASAQEHMDHGMQHGEMVASARTVYETVRGYLTRAAEAMPDEHYSFRPTDDVRTFRELLGHVANANYSYCSAALGVENPNKADIEKTATTKATMVKSLGDSFAHCDRAYAIDEARAHEKAHISGAERPRFYALVQNAAHDFEHYGNVVTYMRMKGLVPPSSAGR